MKRVKLNTLYYDRATSQQILGMVDTHTEKTFNLLEKDERNKAFCVALVESQPILLLGMLQKTSNIS